MENLMIDKAHTTLSKKDTLEIPPEEWEERTFMKNNNIIPGFRSSGI